MGQVEFLAAAQCDWCAQYASGVFQHEIHLLGRNLLGGDNQVALVLTVLVIHHDDEFALPEVVEGLFYGAKSKSCHIILNPLIL